MEIVNYVPAEHSKTGVSYAFDESGEDVTLDLFPDSTNEFIVLSVDDVRVKARVTVDGKPYRVEEVELHLGTFVLTLSEDYEYEE